MKARTRPQACTEAQAYVKAQARTGARAGARTRTGAPAPTRAQARTRDIFDLFRDESGFTTVGMVLALLISLSLVFTGAQVYRINSAAAEVQDIADAAALSAESQVGEFMVVARFCDAVVLTLSLTGIAAMGLGVVALCTPVTATASEKLLKAGADVLKTRDRFAERAARTLNKLQEALPFFSAACAAGVARANNADSTGANYVGVAVLVPSKGEPISVPSAEEASKLLDDINSQADEIRQKAKEAEEAAQEANRCKERAFRRDCGDQPAYCMYERASKLAGLSGAKNPLYTSIDTWSFSVALERAKAYYRSRLDNEAPANNSLDEQARSVLRSHFYRFVVNEMKSAYVHETADSFEANFPHLPHNTEQMRRTELYTKEVYPITDARLEADSESESDSEAGAEPRSQVMHAWAGCPEAAGSVRLGSIQQMEAGDFETCPTCRFTAASLGRVASASTSIDNGFEYHYEAVADEAFNYQDARRRADKPKSEVEEQAGGLLGQLRELLKSTFDKRIDPSPPGRMGALAFVVNVGTTPAAEGFASKFIPSSGALGPRTAISAATLVAEKSDEGKTILNSMLDGLRQNGGAAVGAAGMVLDAWSALLSAYADGQSSINGAIRDGLNALPLASASGLGTWASKKLISVVEGLGLQPVDLRPLKPALVNSGHVAAKGDDAFSSRYVEVKQRVVRASAGASDLFSMVLSDAERQALEKAEGIGDTVEIASIELLGKGGPSVPVTIPIPTAVKSAGIAAIEGFFEQLRSWHAEVGGARVWE